MSHPALDLLRLQPDLRSHLRAVASTHKALVAAARQCRDAFGCAEAAVAVRRPEHTAAELPAVRGGQGDLTQLFLNLCSNARDAMPNGGLLRITGANLPDTVTITIADNGVGIPREILGRIAEPFFTTKEEGNGLGLSICRSILWDLGGDMDIDSTEGQGTTLTLRFPVLQQRTREATP